MSIYKRRSLFIRTKREVKLILYLTVQLTQLEILVVDFIFL